MKKVLSKFSNLDIKMYVKVQRKTTSNVVIYYRNTLFYLLSGFHLTLQAKDWLNFLTRTVK